MADGTPDLSDHLAPSCDQARYKNLVLVLTARIVSAHVSHNRLAPSDLPGLIHKVHASLVQAGTSYPVAGGLVPAVPVSRSVFPDYIICLEDGRRFKTLRRHLMAAFGLTPEQYRRRWSLPHDYPMIAPSYAQNRSGLAKATGLGRGSRTSRVSAKAHSHDKDNA